MTAKPIPPETQEGWTKHVSDNAFMNRIGTIWYRPRGEGLEIGFRSESDIHRNSYGVVHGGMIAAFADFAMGHSVWLALGRKPTVTASLDVSFVSAGPIDAWIHCAPEIVRKGRSLIFIRADIKADDEIVATATGVWKALSR